jgi:dynein heavy chain
MLSQKRSDLMKNRERYETGLIKLKETAEQVATIEEEVKVKGVEAEIKKQEADKFAAKVKIEK